MINIESIKDYIGNTTNDKIFDLATRIYIITDFICEDYPKYKEWFFNKQLPATLNSDKRNILFVRDPNNSNKIISIACLKKDKKEKKICTLFVLKEYRSLGLGTKMIESSVQWLETTKPLITIADYKLDMFAPIIKKYNWKLTEIVSGLYNGKYVELCFNGTLRKNNNSIEQRLQKRLINCLIKRINDIK